MKILIAPQSFKGSISALDVANAMCVGVRRVLGDVEIILVPVADGGDGTLETLVESTGGDIHTSTVTGPLGECIRASWGSTGDGNIAIIEMARMSGLALVPPEKRNPMLTTSYGLGQGIRAALNEGFRSYIIGIGGSATNDGGVGMAQALGVRFLDRYGKELDRGGAPLSQLDHIDMSMLDPRIRDSEFFVASDVNNPLVGPEGASSVYGPQKGATAKMVVELDSALDHFSDIVFRDVGIDMKDIPGAGAAGGIGGGFIAFLNASLRPGVEIVLDAVGFQDHLEGTDLVITGEGQLDFQTVYNKAPIGVAKMAASRNIPVVAISGSLGEKFTDVHQHGIDAGFAITSAPMTLDEATDRAYELAVSTTEQVIRAMQLGKKVFGSNNDMD